MAFNATIKSAAGDVSLERSIANIAYAKLSDKSPKLFDYVKGFQILDQTEDRDQAVGLFGFQIGDKTFRVPIFYRNGRIFGTEIIMPDHKTFRPLNDHWVQYLVSREPDNPGEPTRSSYRSTAPSLWQLSVPPTKWASENPHVAKELAHVKKAFEAYTPRDNHSLLMEVLYNDEQAAQSFRNVLSLYPEIKEAAFKIYDKDELSQACFMVGHGKHLLKKQAYTVDTLLDDKIPKPKLVVIRLTKITKYKFPTTYTHLTGSEKKTLLEGKNVYRDTREESGISDVFEYHTTPGFKKLKNPTKNGIYNIVMPGGGTEKCAVAGPVYIPGGGGFDGVLVVRLSDKAACLAHRSRVYTNCPACPSEEFESFTESGSTINSVGDLPASDPFIIYTCDCEFTSPLKKSYNSPSTGNRTEVCCATEIPSFQDALTWYPRRFPLTNGNPKWDRPGYQNGPYKYVNNAALEDRQEKINPLNAPKAIVLIPKRNNMQGQGNALMVPKESKFIVVKCDDYSTESKFCPMWDQIPTHFDDEAYLDEDTLAEYGKKEATIKGFKNLPKLKVTKVKDGIKINDPRKSPISDIENVLNPLDAEADLVESHGLKAEKAASLIKRAMTDGVAHAYIKYANPYLATPLVQEPPGQDVPHIDRSAGSIGLFHNGINTVRNAEASVQVPSLQGSQLYTLIDPFSADEHIGPAPLEESKYHKSSTFQKAVQLMKVAAHEKTKDLFDSATLSVILKSNSIDSILDTMLTKTLDYINWIGRQLCHVYWNYDKYAERFGKDDVEGIIDRLRDLLEKTGDFYLILEERDSGNRNDSGIKPEDVID